MPTTREVLEVTIALEKQSMALYAPLRELFAERYQAAGFLVWDGA